MISNTAMFVALAILFGAMAWAGGARAQASILQTTLFRLTFLPDSRAPMPDTLKVLVMLPFGFKVDNLPGGFLPRKTKGFADRVESLHGLSVRPKH